MNSSLNQKARLYCSVEMEDKYYKGNNSFVEKTGSLNVIEVLNGIVHPLELSETRTIEFNQYGGVTDENLNFLEQSLTKRIDPLDQSYADHDWYIGASKTRSFNVIDYVDEDVVFIGALSKHYGHFILEGLARLWFYLDTENLKYKCVYISDNGTDLFLETFGLLGIDPHRMQRIEVPTRFRKILIPEPSIRLSDYYHQKYHETVSRIRDSVLPESFDKIYFSKEGISNRRAVGEELIQSIFSRNGFRIFHPEKMSMHDKIAVLRGAKIFVASSGTNVHNSVFLGDHCECVCLNRSAHYYTVQFMIDIMKKLDSVYIDAYIFPNRKRNLNPIGPFLFGPTKYLFDFFESKKYFYNRYSLLCALPFLMITYAQAHLSDFIYSTSWSAYNKLIVSRYFSLRSLAKILLQSYKLFRKIMRSFQSRH